MNRVLRRLRATWRRPKRHGISGNFSTIVIITGIVIGGWLMTGGEYPNIYPTYSTTPALGVPLPQQPKHGKIGTINFRELLFKPQDPKPPVAACGETALLFLADVSTSMKEQASSGNISKLDYMKTAIQNFTQDLPASALFGLYTFSSPNGGEPRERVIPVPYAQSQSLIAPALASIDPPDDAATHMREGFELVYETLLEATEVYSEHRFNLIFISDGVPEQQYPPGCDPAYTLNGECETSEDTNRNYDKRHDPTGQWGDTDIPQEIKELGVNIYSIVISNSADTEVFPELESLMQSISSGDGFFYKSAGGSDLESIYTQIKQQACT